MRDILSSGVVPCPFTTIVPAGVDEKVIVRKGNTRDFLFLSQRRLYHYNYVIHHTCAYILGANYVSVPL